MVQRANGDGSIYKRKDGRWTGAAYVFAADGSERRRQVYGRTRDEVAKKLNELKSATDRGIPAAATTWTVRTYSEQWLAQAGRGDLRPSTLAGYRWMLQKHILPVIGKVKLDRLETSHVRAMHARVADSGVSPRTVALAHAVLRSMLSEAMRDEIIVRNVATLVRPPRVEPTEVEPWSNEEATTFLDANLDDTNYFLYKAALGTGLRKGELLALRWQDVDLQRRTLRVVQTVQRIQGSGLQYGPPKTLRSRRTIPLSQFAYDALRGRHASQTSDRKNAGEKWQENGLIFTTSIGTPLEASNLRRSFDAAIERAGVKRIRFHDMRHTCATMLLAQGVPVRVVMDILGHSSMKVTTDTYGHVLPDALRGAATAIDDAFSPPNRPGSSGPSLG